MIPVVGPFGLIQKDQKVKTLAAGPELRYGTRKNGNSLGFASLKQSVFLIACLHSVLDGSPAKVAFFFFRQSFSPIGHILLAIPHTDKPSCLTNTCLGSCSARKR